jgi:transposase, IS30 family
MVTSRILFTAKQKDELWERWKNGQSVLAISRALERRNKTGVQRIVALNGGIAPAPRCRAVAALKLVDCNWCCTDRLNHRGKADMA